MTMGSAVKDAQSLKVLVLRRDANAFLFSSRGGEWRLVDGTMGRGGSVSGAAWLPEGEV